MRHVRIGHLTRVRVSTIRKFFRYVQEGLPAKLCEIHVMNVVSFFDKILHLIKPFMRAEIFKVVCIDESAHTNLESILILIHFYI